MAGAKSRGFAFTSLPVVIDPAQPELLVKLRTYTDKTEDLDDGDSFDYAPITLYRVGCAVVEAAGMNHYGDAKAAKDCRFILAYNSVGVLQRFMYYMGGEICWERFPEELIGTVPIKPSIRVVFDDQAELDQFVGNLNQLRQYRLGQCSLEIGQQAGTDLINLLLECPEEPRICPVASPTATKEFTAP